MGLHCVVITERNDVIISVILFYHSTAPWASLPVSVTTWCYLFGALSMGLASIYYCTQPEVFVLPVEVSLLFFNMQLVTNF